jgi:hypothetical protein
MIRAQFTFLPPFSAPKIVLPMVTVIQFGFSGYRMGTRNASTRLCRGSVQSSMAYASLGLGSSLKQSLMYSSFRPANLPPPVLKL